jgi:tetratricopeptide (TPR) repeat protein
MIGMVLQFISVGAAIMADRYSYLPYIGASFIIASLLNRYLEKKQTKNLVLGFLLVITPALAFACYNRVKVWNDSGKLWTDVIEKYPYVLEQNGNTVVVKQVGINTAYKNRGNYYREKGDMEKAFADYDLLVRAHAQDEGAYTNMGNFYGLKAQDALAKGDKQLANQHFSKALEMYSEAIKMKPVNYDAYQNRAITYSSMGDHKHAAEDFTKALSIRPEASNLLEKIISEKISAGMLAESIADCDRVLATDPDNANILLCRGTAYINSGRYNEAIGDLERSLKNLPTNGNAWFNLAYAYNKLGNKSKALEAAINARKNGYAVSDQYIQSLSK